LARRKSEESHGWQNRKVNVPIFGFAKNGAPGNGNVTAVRFVDVDVAALKTQNSIERQEI
jgi:hypothetical protein